MKHTYQITGMTCSSCEAKVKSALEQVENITNVEVSKANNSAVIAMNKHVSTEDLQAALDPKYTIWRETLAYSDQAISYGLARAVEEPETNSSWFQTYKPILLIFGFILGITSLVQLENHHFNWMQWMRHFMAGFFLVFSFFKLLNLKGFAESYVMYDILAKRLPAWAYSYAFLELGLGIAYLLDFNPMLTNWITLIVMSISIIGVLQTVLNKKQIRCACLGAIFNLPMSTVTILEDALMIAMSTTMLWLV